jgi:hypothetical protein
MSNPPQPMRPRRPAHGTVVAYLALFVALTGTAWAATAIGPDDIKRNAVRAKHIKNGEVHSSELHGNAVKSGKIADGSVQGGDIGDGQIASADVADESLGSNDLGANSVAGDEVADGSVAATDLGPGSVTGSKVLDRSLSGSDLGINSIGSTELGAGAVSASEIGQFVNNPGPTPTNVPGGVAENCAYSVGTSVADCSGDGRLISGYGQWIPDDAAANDYELWISEVKLNQATQQVIVDGGNDSGVNHQLEAVAVCLLPAF